MKTSPIAIFTYNRPAHTLRMLESLSTCPRLDECDIFIFNDAPRVPEHSQKVVEVRSLIHEWAKEHHARVIERTENLGLSRSIVTSVTELCSTYGQIIVIEDDLVLHPAFIQYMLSALERYRGDEKVGQVSGYIFPAKFAKLPEDAVFLPLGSSWGWATWQRSWELYDPKDPKATEILTNHKLRFKFDLDGAFPYSAMLEQSLQGKNQAWDIWLYWSYFSRGMLTLFPCQSLVNNIGFDGTGYHYKQTSITSKKHSFSTDLADWSATHHFRLPNQVESNNECLHTFQEFLKNIHPPVPLYKRFLHKLKKYIIKINHLLPDKISHT